MDVIKTRCPSCTKLYAVATEDIQTKTPEFECSSCHVRFAFDMPDFIEYDEQTSSTREVQSRLVEWQAMPEMVEDELTEDLDTFGLEEISAAEAETEFEACPKCHYENPVDAEECGSCGVILRRAKEGDNYRSTQRVREQWDRVLGNYEDESRHEIFANFCRLDHCLPFGARKYRAILDADPSEDIALRMSDRLQAMAQIDAISTRKLSEDIPYVSRTFVLATIGAILLAILTVNAIFDVSWQRSVGAVFCLLALGYVTRKHWISILDA